MKQGVDAPIDFQILIGSDCDANTYSKTLMIPSIAVLLSGRMPIKVRYAHEDRSILANEKSR